MNEPRVATVGVIPPAAMSQRRRFFAALEETLPVRFEPRRSSEAGGLDAAIVFGEPGVEAPSGCPSGVLIVNRAAHQRHIGDVWFTSQDFIDRRLRGQSMTEHRALGPALDVEGGERVLAASPDGAVWTVKAENDRTLQRLALEPDELPPDGSLRSNLNRGNFLASLVVLHFLRSLPADHWTPPPLRALFMFDDPNLHWPSYGHIDYASLATDAHANGYHVAMATVPLDAAFAHKKAVRTFHEHSDTLSLCVHGNDHTRQELLATDHESACRALAAQALRRVSAFERRTGLHVSRYVAPPHGVCSEPMARVWARFGMEGICCARPQPWDPRGASAEQPLADWIPANHVAGGLPRFSRYPLDSLRAEIILRAFLDQPIILAGHHQDVADGLDVLRETARLCRGLGVEDWGPCETIGRRNFSTRRAGSSLHVWSLANVIDVDIPNAVDTLHVRLQAPQGEAMPLVAQVGDRVLPLERRASQLQASSIPVTSGTTTRIRISVDPVLSADREPRGRVNPSAVARRMFAEARDRGHPTVYTARTLGAAGLARLQHRGR